MNKKPGPVDEFDRHGMDASYHYADDSCGEWDRARVARDKALEVFDANPGHQWLMREIAASFLWADEFERLRPENKETKE